PVPPACFAARKRRRPRRTGPRPLRPGALRRARAARDRIGGGVARMSAEASPGNRVLVLEAGRAERHYWRDIWAYRELFAILAWRDVAVRYKQTVIGILWAAIRPLLTMVIFTIVFGRLAKLPTEGDAPYPILVF